MKDRTLANPSKVRKMIFNAQSVGLKASFASLQDRIASGLRLEPREHSVLVSVSISDRSGNVLQTIEPDQKTSSYRVGSVVSNGQFATGIILDTHAKRVAAMFEVAAYVWSLAGNSNLVVSATFQDTVVGSNTTMDYVAQAFLKDGKLFIKEVDVADRS